MLQLNVDANLMNLESRWEQHNDVPLHAVV